MGTLTGNDRATIALGSGVLTVNQALSETYAGTITGDGALIKEGAATLQLLGANGYTDGTTVNTGILQLGTGGSLAAAGGLTVNGGIFDLNGNAQTVASLAGAGGSVDLRSGRLTVNQNGSTGYAGTITGTGGLTKSGSGTLTLTGANDYGGGTVVADGTLAGTTTSLQGDIFVALGAHVTFDQDSDGSYAGRLSGDGGLIKSGSGTVILTGDNSYLDGNVVTGGTLQGSSTSLQGSIFLSADSANVTFDRARTSYAGLITGVGSLTKIGNGTLTLTAGVFFGGGTTVSAGTLQGTTDTLRGDFLDNANVTLDQDTDGIFGGRLTGSGTLTKAGSGTVILTGALAQTGGTIIGGGRLQGTTGNFQANILDNAILSFDQNFDGSYSGQISGSGMLEKLGTGTVILTGVNSYAGGTIVSGGTLQGTTASLQGDMTDNASDRSGDDRQLRRGDVGQRQPDQGRRRHADPDGC